MLSLETCTRTPWMGRHLSPEDSKPSLKSFPGASLNICHSAKYEFERRKYAQDLIDFDKKFSALFSGKPRTEDNHNGVSHEEFLEWVSHLSLCITSDAEYPRTTGRAFQKFGLFTSGIGVHYNESLIVNTSYQASASKLVIGERMLPHVFVRASDARPFEIHDLLPADARWKVLVFAGDIVDPVQSARVHALAEQMARPEGFLKRFSSARGGVEKVFDVLTIASGDKLKVITADVPKIFRSHWSKWVLSSRRSDCAASADIPLFRLLVDDQDMFKRLGGGGYEYYGIDPRGAIVIVRPDGYVSMVSPFEHHDALDEYFAAFMKA